MNKKTEKDQLDIAIHGILKDFGQDSLMSMEDEFEYDTVSSGSIRLDKALGKGVPRGRIIEIFGPESSGKTTLCLSVMAQFQKLGLPCFFIDAEHAFDPRWAETMGVNLAPDMLRMSQPSCGEEALQITERLVLAAAPLVVIDSVAALVPKQELDGEIGQSHVGLQARLMSQAMRKLTGITKANHSTIIFINQIREKVGVMFGSPETTSGGRALKFYASQRMDVRRINQIKDGEEVVGQAIRIKVVKNKVAPPFRYAEIELLFKGGISREYEALNMAIQKKLVKASGAWFYFEEEKAQGKEKARQWLVDHPEYTEELIKKIKETA